MQTNATMYYQLQVLYTLFSPILGDWDRWYYWGQVTAVFHAACGVLYSICVDCALRLDQHKLNMAHQLPVFSNNNLCRITCRSTVINCAHVQIDNLAVCMLNEGRQKINQTWTTQLSKAVSVIGKILLQLFKLMTANSRKL